MASHVSLKGSTAILRGTNYPQFKITVLEIFFSFFLCLNVGIDYNCDLAEVYHTHQYSMTKGTCMHKWPPDKEIPLTAAVMCPASCQPDVSSPAQRLSSYLCFQSKTGPPRGHPNRYGGIPQCPIYMARMPKKLVSTHRRHIGDIDPHVPWCRHQHIHGHIGETVAGGPPQSWVRGAAPPTPARGWMRDGGTADTERTASAFPSPHRPA